MSASTFFSNGPEAFHEEIAPRESPARNAVYQLPGYVRPGKERAHRKGFFFPIQVRGNKRYRRQHDKHFLNSGTARSHPPTLLLPSGKPRWRFLRPGIALSENRE